MLQIRNLSMIHKKDLHTMLTDFSLTLNKGDKAAIIGEEGNGKSTLLKWIYDPKLVEGYAQVSGERHFPGESLGYLPQELPEEEKELSLYEFFSQESRFWDCTPGELGRLAGWLGISQEFFYGEQRMETLSGGEKVKAQLARLLLSQPTVLLLDEPSNDLDIETLQWLERLLLQFPDTVLFISHDETLIERTANVVIHLEQLRRKTVSRHLVAKMDYRTYLEERRAAFQNQEQKAKTEQWQERIRQEKLRKIQQRVEQDLRAVSRQDPHGGYLLKKKMKAVKSLERRYEREAGEMTQLPEEESALFVKFDDKIRLPGSKVILDFYLDRLMAPGEGRLLAEQIRLKVRGPEKICIIGKNGAGKTTLFRKIAGELLERKDIKAAYMPQNYQELLELSQTPLEYLTVTGDKEEQTRIRTYLGAMKYTADEMSHPVSELSGGQKAKILLLKMSMSGADVLLLDEPTRNFSPLSNPVIRQVLSDYKGAIISISHDRKYIRQVCSRVYRLTKDGLMQEEIDF